MTRLQSLTEGTASARLEPAVLAVTAAALTAGVLPGSPVTGARRPPVRSGHLRPVLPAVGWVLAALRHGRAGVDLIAVLAPGGTLACADGKPNARVAAEVTGTEAV
ncbi:hypothetical protein GCM10017687_66230 [Streptomyces echinatus]